MKPYRRQRLFVLAATLITLGFSGAVFAQYVWLDEKGTKQFSDMPPPASVPANRILKQPGLRPAADVPNDEPALTEKPAAKTEMSIAEKNAEFRKRHAEQAEKEKKAAEEARQAAEKAKYCDQAREYSRALQSGERISRRDKNGERSFLTDEQRAQEARDTRRILDDCK